MYENQTYKINWISILIKVLIVIGIVLVIFMLLPKSSDNSNNQQVFIDNLNNMKDAAKDYFKLENLPEKIGGSLKITLGDMEDKNLLVPFKDKNGDECNKSESYAQVTKNSESSYTLKVSLTCSDESNYILDTISVETNNTDESEENINSENNDEKIDWEHVDGDKDGNIIEYEYRRLLTEGKYEYLCPSGYEMIGNKCYKTTYGETIKAETLYFEDTIIVTDAEINKTDEVIVTIDPIKTEEGVIDVCPEGYTLNDGVCIKYMDATVVPGSTSYSCPYGGTIDGDKCIITIDAEETPAETINYCPNGGDLVGDKCVLYTDYQPSVSTTPEVCTCPNGKTPVNGRCDTSYSYAATPSYSWSNPEVQVTSQVLSEYENSTSKRVLVNQSCSLGKCSYTYYTYHKVTNYSCPNGGNVSGTSCIVSGSVAATCTPGTTSYYCPNGGTYNGSVCHRDDSYKASQKTEGPTYYCPDGYEKNGQKCTKTYDATKEEGTTTYECPEGYVLDGTTCYKVVDKEQEVIYSYSCPEGYTSDGEGENMTCSKVTEVKGEYYCVDSDAVLQDDKCYKTIKGTIKGYECPSGYIQEGDMCIKKDVHCVYPTLNEVVAAEYEYTWSINNNLPGWKKTGRTRIYTGEI